jgi:hypothetical protein
MSCNELSQSSVFNCLLVFIFEIVAMAYSIYEYCIFIKIEFADCLAKWCDHSHSCELEHAGVLHIIGCVSLFRWQYFLKTNLVNQMLSAQVDQMRPFLVVR